MEGEKRKIETEKERQNNRDSKGGRKITENVKICKKEEG